LESALSLEGGGFMISDACEDLPKDSALLSDGRMPLCEMQHADRL
jgi:hypothetical protein